MVATDTGGSRMSNHNRKSREQRRLPVEPILRWIAPVNQRKYSGLFKPGRTIRFHDADRFCIKELGLHPFFVYGDEWYDG
jgi:hypothetical protein